MKAPRYAIYFAPLPEEPLAQFGRDVLGYDAETGTEIRQLVLPGISDSAMWEATRDPRFYGFHATLKAPFHLAHGSGEDHLRDALAGLAEGIEPFAIDLRLSAIGGFLALVPVEVDARLQALESEIVDKFDGFRAPLTPADVVRRLKTDLTDRQKSYLARHGYPFVKEEFRFHMTLTGKLDAGQRDLFAPALQAALDGYTHGPRAEITSLALFRQETREDRFRIVGRVPLGRGAMEGAARHRSVMREA